MNVHHLELFYYVAKYEGITPAVRQMPYGIQQPAVSGQMLQLEKELGVKLFNRRPFKLTVQGEELYDFARPFFSQLQGVEESLKNEASYHLRVAASASVLRHHLPEVLETLKLEEPRLKLTLQEVEPAEMITKLSEQEVDVGMSILCPALGEGMRSELLLSLPLSLWVPEALPVNSLDDLLKSQVSGSGKCLKVPLVGLPVNEVLSQTIKTEFKRRNIQGVHAVEVNSLDVVQRYVAKGFGVAIGVEVPGTLPCAGVKEIELKGFPKLKIGVLHQGELSPLAQRFLEIAKCKALQLEKK